MLFFPVSNFGEIGLPYHFFDLFLDHVNNGIFICCLVLVFGLGTSALVTSLTICGTRGGGQRLLHVRLSPFDFHRHQGNVLGLPTHQKTRPPPRKRLRGARLLYIKASSSSVAKDAETRRGNSISFTAAIADGLELSSDLYLMAVALPRGETN